MSGLARQTPWDEWVGRSEERTDVIGSTAMARLAALLDYDEPPWPAGEAPALGHWLTFLPQQRQSLLDVDGHPRRGAFLPPIPLPRRMWAGGSLTFHRPTPLDVPLVRRSTIVSVTRKPDASEASEPAMAFVALRHEILAGAEIVLEEIQDIVYRRAPTQEKAAGGRARTPDRPSAPTLRRRLVADPVQLFRFSALTFNAHRIHYDRDYARDVEGYPGLIVHGPYCAILLVDMFLRAHPRARIAAFGFRAHRPLFAGAPFELQGAVTSGGAQFCIVDEREQVTMSAQLAVQA